MTTEDHVPRDELLDIIRDLLVWADTYEDNMTPDGFRRRAESMKRARQVLLAERGTLA